jgi:SAM-dependent methyltransferase
MKVIDPDTISFDPASFVDPTGRVFTWQGGIYRAVLKGRAPFIRRLLEEVIEPDPVLSELFVETETTDLRLEGYELVLKHRRVPYQTYCTEWPAAMLKDAALMTLRIARALARHNLVLQDAHPYNIFFDGARPYFIDLGSVVQAHDDHLWRAYNHFCAFFLHPLYLASAKLAGVIRPMLMDTIRGIPGRACAKMLPVSYMLRHPRTFTRLVLPTLLTRISQALGMDESVRSASTRLAARTDLAGARTRFYEALERDVGRISLPEQPSHWSGYYRGDLASTSADDLLPKDDALRRIFQELEPKSVLDLGCNVGRYSTMAAREGATVIACDTDETCVSHLYHDALRNGDNILPLVMDAVNPTPAFGWCARQYPAATDRLQVEMVLALALVHHMAIHQMQSFERIVGVLAAFSTRWLVVEFVGREDHQARQMLAHTSRDYGWYELDGFVDVLRATFKKVTKLEPALGARSLFLCER